jgi:hypothetical protein
LGLEYTGQRAFGTELSAWRDQVGATFVGLSVEKKIGSRFLQETADVRQINPIRVHGNARK